MRAESLFAECRDWQLEKTNLNRCIPELIGNFIFAIFKITEVDNPYFTLGFSSHHAHHGFFLILLEKIRYWYLNCSCLSLTLKRNFNDVTQCHENGSNIQLSHAKQHHYFRKENTCRLEQ
jgi:hypothetical protein